MQVSINSVISGIFGIIIALITYNYKLKEVGDKVSGIAQHKGLSKEHDGLSKEHDGLSKEHDGLSKEHDGLSKEHNQLKTELADKVSMLNVSINENKEITRTVEKILVEDKTKSEFQYNNLTDKQKDLINSVSKLQNFAREMKILQEERNNVLEENKNLRAENSNLKEQCLNYVQIISNLTKEKAPQKDRGLEL